MIRATGVEMRNAYPLALDTESLPRLFRFYLAKMPEILAFSRRVGRLVSAACTWIPRVKFIENQWPAA